MTAIATYPKRLLSQPDSLGLEKLSLTSSDDTVPWNWLSALVPDATGNQRRNPSASASARQHIYQPLNASPQTLEIRLIEIESDDDDQGRMSCILRQMPLDQAPEYDALSYHWGDSSDRSQRRTILINCWEFEIQLNLWDAMQALRRRGHTTLWADAVCLNQEDDEEKAQQVPRMKLIYQQARGVAIWLGQEADGSAEFMDFIKDMASTNFNCEYQKWLASRTPVTEDESRTILPKSLRDEFVQTSFTKMLAKQIRTDDDDISDEQLNLMCRRKLDDIIIQQDAFLTRPYWRRMWIIQEVAVARSVAVFCGTEMIRWNDLKSLCLVDDGTTDWTDVADVSGRNIDIIEKLRYKVHNRIPIGLLTALQRSEGFEAGRPQDKFYALLGLAWDADRYIRTVSYSKAFTPNRIMFDIAREWMKSGCIDIICLQPQSMHNDLRLPSWLPKWLCAGRTSMGNRLVDHVESRRALTLLTKHGHSWAATGRSESKQHRFLDNGRVLLVRGVHFDTIDGLSAACDHDFTDTSLCQIWHSRSPAPVDIKDMKRIRSDLYWTLNMHKAHATNEILDQSVNLDVLYSLDTRQYFQAEDFTGMIKWLDALHSFRIFRRPFEQWLLNRPKYRNRAKLFVHNTLIKDHQEWTSRAGHEQSLVNAFQSVFDDGRRLMTTRGGKVGWAHPSARPGDRIYLLEGCNLPVILTPCTVDFEGYRTCKLVGDAYVHGIMRGEAWEGDRDTELGDGSPAGLTDIFLR